MATLTHDRRTDTYTLVMDAQEKMCVHAALLEGADRFEKNHVGFVRDMGRTAQEVALTFEVAPVAAT